MFYYSTSIASNLAPNANQTCFILQSGSLQPIAFTLGSEAANTPVGPLSVPREPTPNAGTTSTERTIDVLKDVNNKKTEGNSKYVLKLFLKGC